MLGMCVRASVVRTIGEKSPTGYIFPLNLAKIYDTKNDEFAFILGVDHPVKNFDGMIIAKLQSLTERDKHFWIMAPKSRKYIINVDIIKALDLKNNFKDYKLICLYEHSAGAVTYTYIDGVPHFLLIKNKNSVNWGFPKGHREEDETKVQTAEREVFEETGIKIQLHDGFERSSAYTANHTVKKLVTFFVGFSQDDNVTLQAEELCDYVWLPFDEAKHTLTFNNDKKVLSNAWHFLIDEGIIKPSDEH
ncbi:MAG: NUDIX domain-containing protein [Eubacterium sp.]|nr:NUDIX domain-containing protein [Eubacterium sp.]